MLYLLDSNTLISANNEHYPIDRLRPFWDWLIGEGEAGNVKIPLEIYEEIKKGNDLLADWVGEEATRAALMLDEEVNRDIFNRVIDQAYATNLSDDEMD